MPRYRYYCSTCLDIFEEWHGMGDNLSECSKCGATDCLTRVPSMVSDYKEIVKHKKTGDLTNEYIEENRKELQEMKRNAKKQGIKK